MQRVAAAQPSMIGGHADGGLFGGVAGIGGGVGFGNQRGAFAIGDVGPPSIPASEPCMMIPIATLVFLHDAVIRADNACVAGVNDMVSTARKLRNEHNTLSQCAGFLGQLLNLRPAE